MKRAKVQSVEGYLPFVAVEIAESNRLLEAEREARAAWKRAGTWAEVEKKRARARARAEAVAGRRAAAVARREERAALRGKVEGPKISADNRRWVRSWLRVEAGKVQTAAQVAERAKWAGYWDNVCKFVGVVAAVEEKEAA